MKFSDLQTRNILIVVVILQVILSSVIWKIAIIRYIEKNNYQTIEVKKKYNLDINFKISRRH